MAEPALRPARPDEAEALARLHLAVWRETYRDLAPPEAYAALDLARRQAQWQAALAAPPPSLILVAQAGPPHCEEGALVRQRPAATQARPPQAAMTGAAPGLAGLVSLGPASQIEFDEAGEIRHLYVAAPYRGTGLGARLLRAGLAALAASGHTRAALAVVEANAAARAFYRRQGGVEGASFRDKGPLWRSENLVVWFDLSGRD